MKFLLSITQELQQKLVVRSKAGSGRLFDFGQCPVESLLDQCSFIERSIRSVVVVVVSEPSRGRSSGG